MHGTTRGIESGGLGADGGCMRSGGGHFMTYGGEIAHSAGVSGAPPRQAKRRYNRRVVAIS